MVDDPGTTDDEPSGLAVRIGAVVVVGLLAGAALALVVARGDHDDGDPADADAAVLAVAALHDVAVDDARCAVDRLVEDGTLDDDLTARLLDAAAAATPGTSPAAVVDAVAACAAGGLEPALVAAGVPDELVACAAATIGDAGPGAIQRATLAPLAPDSFARSAIAACALDHLAAALQTDAGIDGPDAQCVADQVIERVGLEPVLASIGALAVSAEVTDAGTAAVTACAAATP